MSAAAKVLIVHMPYGALDRPALGLALLKSALEAEGVAAEVSYLNLRFADFVGLDDYQWVHGGVPSTAFVGDWTFTEALYGPRPAVDAAYESAVLRREWRLDDDDISRLRRVRAWCEPFLQYCLDDIAWAVYDVIGFSSTFEQNLASLALARRIKRLQPGVSVVFGGANWEGEMGVALHECFPFVDAACSGEAERSFPRLVQALAAGDQSALDDIPGIVFRRDGASVATGPPDRVADLDELPRPDLSDFTASLAESRAAAWMAPLLLLETARGCWWGARSHCTFCGLNGEAMAFRSKSPDRVLSELAELRDRHGATAVSVVDNILDMRYFRSLLPRLADERTGVRLFWEVKANLDHDHVRVLADAGVERVQPGIESLSNRVLELMRKGTTALRNAALLKWCQEYAVVPEWNLLFGFPGETASDYEATADLVRAIWHLQPPGAIGPIRMDRFSPYHDEPTSFGLTGVRPMLPFRFLYPFPAEQVARIAPYFDFDYADGRDPRTAAGETLDLVQAWMDDGARGTLTVRADDGGGLVLADTRGSPAVPARTTAVDGWQAEIYRACDRHRPRAELGAIAQKGGGDERALDRFLADCAAAATMATDGASWLSLAVHSPPCPSEVSGAGSESAVRRGRWSLVLAGR